MTSVLLALIQQLNSAVFVLIAILILAFWIMFKSGGWVKSYKDFESKNIKLDDKIDNIKDNIAKIQATAELLYQAHLSTIKSHSPISLTEKGKEVFDGVSAEMKVNSHWGKIKEKIEKSNPKNPYDVQVVSLNLARDCFDSIFTEKERDEIKTYAFNTGLNLLEIYPVIGVTIRDRYFKEKAIELTEVDKHDPKNFSGEL